MIRQAILIIICSCIGSLLAMLIAGAILNAFK